MAGIASGIAVAQAGLALRTFPDTNGDYSKQMASVRRPVHEADLIRRFDAAGNSAETWRRTGRELLAAGDHLYSQCAACIEYDPPRPREHFDFIGPADMLKAMAVECFLKALLLDSGLVLAKDGRYKGPNGVKSHDLVGYALAAGFTTSAEERAVLKFMSRCITSGRYPIPKSWTEKYRLRPEGTYSVLGSGIAGTVMEQLAERLLERLSDQERPSLYPDGDEP